jgi:hypothetical protein
VFTAEGIDKVTEEFLALRGKLAKVAVDVVTAWAKKTA